MRQRQPRKGERLKARISFHGKFDRMRWRNALLLAAFLLAGCQSWGGEAEVRLRSGETIRCPRGLRFDSEVVWCQGSGVKIYWRNVAGYTAR